MYKSKINEYCQKYELDRPEYITCMSEINKTPVFNSSVNFNGEIYTDKSVFSNKKLAEDNIAKIVYLRIQKNKKLKRIRYKGDKNILLCVDVENQPNIIEEIDEMVEESQKLHICLCISKYHNQYNNMMKYNNKYIVKAIDSSDKDSADILMVFYLGLVHYNYDKIGIITHDHFAKPLCHLLDNGKILRNMNDVIEFID